MLTTRSRARGYSLVELLLVVAMAGILAVIATFAVGRYVASAKTTEARNTVGTITRYAVVAYERSLAPGAGVEAATFCPSSSQVPAEVPHAAKYQSTPADWDKDPGWSCLRFRLDAPQYFSYRYAIEGDAPAAPSLLAPMGAGRGNGNGDNGDAGAGPGGGGGNGGGGGGNGGASTSGGNGGGGSGGGGGGSGGGGGGKGGGGAPIAALGFSVTAHGDLNGNGRVSTLQIHGRAQEGAVATSATPGELDPEE
jgi:type IV pilus assembly protein PilA